MSITAPTVAGTNSTAVAAGIMALTALGALVLIRQAFGHLSITL